MKKLYYSKGISKSATIRKIVAIVICLIISVTLFVLVESKIDGPKQSVSLGGQIHQISTERYRFSSDEQSVIMVLGFTFFALAAIDIVLLALYHASWTEIYSDSIKANSMGKTVSCYIKDISQISKMGTNLLITASSGKITIITKDPAKAHKIIEDLLLHR